MQVHNQSPKSTRSHINSFALTTLIAIAPIITIAAESLAQCYIDPITGQQVCPLSRQNGAPAAPRNPPTVQASAHCRISVANGTLGSGTLVGRNESLGLVLTCAHLFEKCGTDFSPCNSSTPPQIIVTFPTAGQFAAQLVAIDRANDLAALSIRCPQVEPLPVAEGDPAGLLTACGFGPNGVFRAMQGSIAGSAKAAAATYPSIVMCGAVRPGDSGGAVLNTRGQLVGVVWGQRDCQTYATCGRPVCEFLNCVRGKLFGNQQVVANRQPSASPPPQAPSPHFDWQTWTSELDARIRVLDAKKQDKGDFLQHGDLNGYVRNDEATKRFDSVHTVVESIRQRAEQIATDRDGILRGISLGKFAAGALGLSGPLAAAVVIAGGIAGRRIKSRLRRLESKFETPPANVVPIAIDTPPPPQRTVPETHYVPVEKDSFAKAHQWASEHVVRKYPGATEVLQAQESLIKQFLVAK